MQAAPPNPVALPVTVDTTGAKILEESMSEHDSRDIYLPNHVETVSHIAIDVGGSLAKVVYFTRIARPTAATQTHSVPPLPSQHSDPLSSGIPVGARSPASPASNSRMHSRESSANVGQYDHALKQTAPTSSSSSASSAVHAAAIAHTADGLAAVPAGTLTPTSLFASRAAVSASAIHSQFMKRRSLPSQLPGGRLNFVKFETADIGSCVTFLKDLINMSAKANNVSLAQMRKGVKLMATGGGAHLYNDLFEEELGVEVRREDEMGCLITGLNFITLIPDETFYYSDELVDSLSATLPGTQTRREDPRSPMSSSSSSLISNGSNGNAAPLPRPSPDPPLYSPVFDSNPLPKLPCLLVNIGSGVSIIKVDEDGKFERVSGTSLGGGTLWGLLSLLTDAESFDEMLEMASRGDNGTVDMLVSDVYGASDALSNLGLKSTTIASSFGKVFRKDKSSSSSGDGTTGRGKAREERRKRFRQEDICKSLLYAISNNIGQIAYMNAEKFGLDRIYFGGCFIRGHQATIATLSYAIRFWSKGSKRAFFLRHEGYLGALGAWIRQFYDGNGMPQSAQVSPGGTPTYTHPTAAAAQHAYKHLVGGSGVRNSGDEDDYDDGDDDATAVRLPSTIALPTPIAEEPSESNQATPRQKPDGSAARSHAITPALSRSQSAAAHASSPLSSKANEVENINPNLAEALGGIQEQSGRAPAGDEPDGNNDESDITVSQVQANGHQTSQHAELAELSELLESLSQEDRHLFGELAEIQRGSSVNGTAAAPALANESDDVQSIHELLQKMDVVNGAADGLEGKLDSLLARLDTILHDAEAEQQT